MGADGIDVSHFQKSVNWLAVAGDGISFAFVKATEGTSFTAATFASNWARVRAAGLIRGAYHFFRPLNAPQAQAEYFLNTAQFELGDLPPVLDIESTGSLDAGANTIRASRRKIRRSTGCSGSCPQPLKKSLPKSGAPQK